ncbi:LytTR family transcriptional regulator [Tateyamaria omphalii]|uniref:LytTR family DNA-binding domain-containing protein n=1 Tax=Tateyamaria omphalii TaxID=299262 RepID=UPI001C99EDE9|nr:LytTR family DNA-binding domain-containing protein [Tateyamaria omphalii]MBY5932814.1 LytTR family transcriptional regulator [Tateyamaria omphalii]
MFRSAYDHEVQVYVSNGSLTHFTMREVHELYGSWQLWVLVMVGFLIMATGHPVTLPQFDSFGLRLAFWFIALFVYLLLSMVYSLGACRVWRTIVGGPIPLIVLSSPLVLAATYITSVGLTYLFEPHKPPLLSMSWQMNVRNVLVAHVFETTALMWLLPAQRARKATTPQTRSVTLSGRTMALDRVMRVKAAEHYLEIYTPDGVEILRERLATFLEQVRPEDGIQTHRSHWVAREKAQSLSGSKLTLSCGEKVPVARGRLEAVRAWLDDHAETREVA